jgi:toxin-antitoxin system PIN domain toxin
MKMLDVNVLVYAFQREDNAHLFFSRWLTALLGSDESFAVPELVLSSFVRVATLSRIWKVPATVDEALAFCGLLHASPRCLVVHPTERHWELFATLCRDAGARGNLVTDAYLAAFALDRGDEWVTADRDFGKFPGLTWRLLPENRRRTNPR